MKTHKAIHKFTGPLVINFCVLSVTTAYGLTLPASADIKASAQSAVQAADTFMQESIEARLAYECSGGFLSQHQQAHLHSLAEKSSGRMGTIINSQKLLKKQIEDYEGNDWDQRYGESGLWRMIQGSLEQSILFQCEIDYFQALSSKGNEKRLILYDILERLSSLRDDCRGADCALLKTRIFMELSPENNEYKRLARNLLGLLLAEPNIDERAFFKATIAKIKLTEQIQTGRLEELAVRLAHGRCKDDFELNLSAAFLFRRFGFVKSLERVAARWPEARAFMGKIILRDLQLHKLEKLSCIEAELVAQAARQSGPAQYADLLNALSSQPELQSPLVLYITAMAQADSSPVKAIEMLVRASQIQQLQKSDEFSVPAEKIAGRAAELAYQLFTRESNCCGLARRAIANYINIARGNPEQKIEFFYAVVLNGCGRPDKGIELLKKIADSNGKYRYRAEYELIALTAREPKYNQPEQRAGLIRRLNNLITAMGEPDEFDREVRNDAKLLYCQLLVAQGDKDSAERALSILAEFDKPLGQKLYRLNSQALQCAGQLKEALQVLNEAIDLNDCVDALQGLILLSKITEKIEEYELLEDDFENFLKTCCGLAEYCFRCAPSSAQQEAAMILAELSILGAGKQEKKLLAIEKQFSDLIQNVDEGNVDVLRCRARLFTALERHDEAVVFWSQICQIRKAEELWKAKPCWSWWRAKYYQLDCQSRIPGSSREDLLHSLDVLEPSFGEIPEPWAERFSVLKKTLEQRHIILANSN